MDKELLKQGSVKIIEGFIILCLLIFVPAGTIHFRYGWLFMAILFIPMVLVGAVMLKKNPELLRKRLNSKEKESEQKEVVRLSGLMFLATFIVAGLNYRFGWIRMPSWLVYSFAVIFLISYAMFWEVMRENEYLSRTVEIQENQKVVDTGLYGVVRHPMYAVTVFLFLSMPLVLGSPLSFVIMLAYIPIIVKRIHNEEEVLEKGLEGYSEYKKKVRYRLVPFIW